MFHFHKTFGRVLVVAVLAALLAVVAPVSSAHAADVSATDVARCAQACGVRAVRWSAVNMRSGPGTGYVVTGQLPRGSRVRVLSTAHARNGQAWMRVRVNGCVAWVIAASLG